jgi:HEAT repeat protein
MGGCLLAVNYEMNGLTEMLAGGDRRSIGRSEEVVAAVLADETLFQEVFLGLDSQDPLVCMRAADALEKITARRPELLQPYKAGLIERARRADQQELRWHAAQMLPRLELNDDERRQAVEILMDYLKDKSSIVKTFTMQALADLAEQDAGLWDDVINILQDLTQKGTPAMQSRGRKILAKLDSSNQALA